MMLQIRIDLSSLEDIYATSRQLLFKVGIDACREYVDESLSSDTAPMLLEMYGPTPFNAILALDILSWNQQAVFPLDLAT
jgi:hypothetical protein